MKFVYNAEKEAKSREILMMQPTVQDYHMHHSMYRTTLVEEEDTT